MRTTLVALLALAIGCGRPPSDPEENCTTSIDDSDPCTVDTCDPETGAASHTPVVVDDGDACTVDACTASGQTHTPKCDDGNVCSGDTCDVAATCSHTALDSTAMAIVSGSPVGAMQTIVIEARQSGDFLICAGGPDETAIPPKCIVEVDFGQAELTFHGSSVTGIVPVRMQDLPVSYRSSFGTVDGSLALNGNQACPGQSQSFLPVGVEVIFDPQGTSTAGLSLLIVMDEPAIRDGLNVCDSQMSDFAALIKQYAAAEIRQRAEQFIRARVEAQLCVVGPPCPQDATADQDGVCRYDSFECVPRGLHPDTGVLIVPACLQ